MEGYVVVISMLSFRCNVAPNPLVACTGDACPHLCAFYTPIRHVVHVV